MSAIHSILFLCTGNSCRSQMAEAIASSMYPHVIWCSAGTQPAANVAQRALSVLQEKGYPVANLYPKHVNEFIHRTFDVVVSLCDSAAQECPVFTSTHLRLHRPFPDPYAARGSEDEVLAVYRNVCNDIENWVKLELRELLQRGRSSSLSRSVQTK